MSHPCAPPSRPRRRYPPETWAALEAGWTAGGSPAALSRRHGVPLSTLKERAAREGWVRAPAPSPPSDTIDASDDDLPEDAAILARAAWRHAARAVMAGDRLEARAWTRLSQDLRAVAEADALREQRMADDLTREFAPLADEMAADGVEPVLLMRDVPPRPGRREPNPLDVALAQAEAVAWAKLHLSIARTADAPEARPIDKAAAASVLAEMDEARRSGSGADPAPADLRRRRPEVKSARPCAIEAAGASPPRPSDPVASATDPADPADPADFSQRPEPSAPTGESSAASSNPPQPSAPQPPPPVQPEARPARTLGPYWDRLNARDTVSPAERYLRDLGRRLLQGSDTTGFDLSARRVWFEAKAAELLGPDVLRVLPAPALCVPNATPTSGPRVALL